MTAKELKCFTANPGLTTLYGLKYGYSNSLTMSNEPDTMILFKSRVNLRSVDDTQWSIVGTLFTNTTVAGVITRSNIYVACAINDAGVFTAVVCDKDAPGSEVKEGNRFQGIRYDPLGKMGATENSILGGGAGGKGRWSTIDVASDYNLTEFPIYNGHKLFYTVEDGKETLLHAYTSVVSPSNATVIRLGHVSEHGDRPLLQHSTTYK
ncbi:hypothetical protein BGZ96_010442, partial [Linnemannia gamsii]